MKYRVLIQKDIDNYLKECHFTDREKKVFLLRCEGKTLYDIAELLNETDDTIGKIARAVKEKICEVGVLPKMCS